LALHLGFIFLPEKGLTCQKGSNFPTFRKEKGKKSTHKPKRQDDDHTWHNGNNVGGLCVDLPCSLSIHFDSAQSTGNETPPKKIPETHNKHRGKMEAVRKVQPQDLLSGCHNICDCVVEALQRKEQRTIQSCELQAR
jgi:hypothetical protein